LNKLTADKNITMNEQALQQLAAQLRQPTGEEGIKTGEWMNRGNVHINLDTLEILNASKDDNILEIGMGNGFFVKNILQKHISIKYTGADFSEPMVNESERINEAWVNNGQATFVLSDMILLPFTNGSFNKIFTINSIYFWDDTVKILAEMKRLLLPKGKLIITFRPKRLMKNYPFTKYGFNLFAKEEALQLLTQNGFTILHAIEKQEPDFELNGEMIKMESLIIEATKQ
jgi:ubiquinone/menaquinone biosynthesis C-methylase UbiE